MKGANIESPRFAQDEALGLDGLAFGGLCFAGLGFGRFIWKTGICHCALLDFVVSGVDGDG